jgi:hypothetical protein
MKTVLILPRGRRLSALFGRLAKELGQEYRVIVVFRAWRQHSAHDPADWTGIDNLTFYDLRTETRTRVKDDVRVCAGKIEKELELSVYRSASNYFLYRRFAKDYFGGWAGFYDSEREFFEEFVASHSLMSEIFDRHRPDLVFCETPDFVSHRVAQAVAFKRGVFTLGLMFNNVFGNALMNFTYGCNYRNPVMEFFYKNPGEISRECWQKADSLLSKLADSQIHEAEYIQDYKDGIAGSGSTLAAIQRAVRRISTLSDFEEARSIALRSAAAVRNRRWLDRNLKRELPRGEYILLSLHYQPEASTCLAAPRWVDQDKIVEQLAINAPSDIRIAVKENPRKYGLRGRRYYSRLRDFGNVDLIHPLTSNDQLIRNAAAVVSITGTVGVEGIALGKKVGILGRPAYDVYEGVRKLDHPEEIFAHLRDPNWNPGAMIEPRRQFLAALAESVFSFGQPESGPWPPPDLGGPNLARAIRSFLTFLDRTAFKPDRLPATL